MDNRGQYWVDVKIEPGSISRLVCSLAPIGSYSSQEVWEILGKSCAYGCLSFGCDVFRWPDHMHHMRWRKFIEDDPSWPAMMSSDEGKFAEFVRKMAFEREAEEKFFIYWALRQVILPELAGIISSWPLEIDIADVWVDNEKLCAKYETRRD